MKILHVIRGLANSSGTTHIVCPLAEAQARLGHTVEVFHVEKPNEGSIEPDPSLVKSTMFPMSIRSRHYGYSRAFSRAMRGRVGEFDVVHIHAIWNYVTWYAMRHAKKARVPFVVAPQGSLEDWALGRSQSAKKMYSRLFEKRLFDSAAAMQALTESERQQCRNFGIAAPAEILPNGVDLEHIDSIIEPADFHAEFDLPPTEFTLLFLGRIFPKKGIDILAESFGRIVAKRSDVTLIIVGHDAGQGYQRKFKQALVNRGADKKCIFLGEIKGDRKFQLLKAADLFVLPSYSEGLPVAVLEAMSTSTPVLITPGCNIPEVAKSEAGWIRNADVDSFSSGLEHALASRDELRRRGECGRVLLESNFTWKKIADRSVEMYSRLSNS